MGLPRCGALWGGLAVLAVLGSCMGLPVPSAGVVRAALVAPRTVGRLSEGGVLGGLAAGELNGHSRCVVQEEGCSPAGVASEGLRLRGGMPATKVQASNPQVKAMKQAAVWTAKGITAAFTGLLTTSSVMVAFEFTAHKLHPAAVAAAQVPDSLAAMVLVGSVVGSVLGSLVSSKLAPSHPSIVALLVSALFTAAQYLNIQAIDHPAWFNIAGMFAFVPPYVATALLTRGGAAKLWKMVSGSSGSSKGGLFKAATAAAKPSTPKKMPTKAPEVEIKTPRRTSKKEEEPPASSVKKNLKTPGKKSKKK